MRTNFFFIKIFAEDALSIKKPSAEFRGRFYVNSYITL